MRVNVYTIERGKSDLESDRKNIRWDNASDRKWFMNHLKWAIHNNRTVTVTPIHESF